MAFELQNNAGSLFRNKRIKSPDDPSHLGKARVAETLYKLTATVSVERGERIFSVTLHQPAVAEPPGRGVLRRNKAAKNERFPTHVGKATVAGIAYTFAAWIKEAGTASRFPGEKFFALAFQRVEPQPAKRNQPTRSAGATPPAQPAARPSAPPPATHTHAAPAMSHNADYLDEDDIDARYRDAPPY